MNLFSQNALRLAAVLWLGLGAALLGHSTAGKREVFRISDHEARMHFGAGPLCSPISGVTPMPACNKTQANTCTENMNCGAKLCPASCTQPSLQVTQAGGTANVDIIKLCPEVFWRGCVPNRDTGNCECTGQQFPLGCTLDHYRPLCGA